MKNSKIILFCICFCSVLFSLSQEQKNRDFSQKLQKESVETFRDRLIVDVFHSFWMNVPNGVTHKFNPGFNVAVLWDFKATKKSPISFGLGIGCTYHTQFSNAQLRFEHPSGPTRYHILPDVISHKDSMKLNRMTYINCNIPLEFRYRHKSGFKFTVGMRLGLVAELSQRYKGKSLDGSGIDENYKYFLTTDRQKVNFDVYMRCGWKFVGVYYSYQVNKLFNEGKGPAVNPMSVGISLSLF
ncbi:MAG: hypothetical protein FWC34_10775 [Bacteroidetes bacterium]|nr:hypothetical protein [Bacteroidota bacterium]MCL2302739.1 hypothetical protein [Lentimicrobiaceae bacterium]